MGAALMQNMGSCRKIKLMATLVVAVALISAEQHNEANHASSFKQFDKNEDGMLSGDGDELPNALRGLAAHLSKEEIDNIVEDADADGDDEINKDEFFKIMKRANELIVSRQKYKDQALRKLDKFYEQEEEDWESFAPATEDSSSIADSTPSAPSVQSYWESISAAIDEKAKQLPTHEPHTPSTQGPKGIIDDQEDKEADKFFQAPVAP